MSRLLGSHVLDIPKDKGWARMRKVNGGVIMDGITTAKRQRMEGALWRLEQQMRREFPMGRPTSDLGVLTPDVRRYNRIDEQISILRTKLGK